MLVKLMKYEFRATARYYLPIYAALAIVSLLSLAARDGEGFAGALVAITYALLVLALIVIAIVATVLRFYKNLLCAEGYLMFTLPVTAGQNILGKLIPAVCWQLGSLLLGLLTLIPWAAGQGAIINSFGGLWSALRVNMGFPEWTLFLTFLVCLPLAAAACSLFCYLCMGLGQLFEHKFMASVIIFIGLQTLLQILSVTLLFAIGTSDLLYNVTSWEWLQNLVMSFSPNGALLTGCLVLIGLQFLACLIQFLITRRLLSRRLNLA